MATVGGGPRPEVITPGVAAPARLQAEGPYSALLSHKARGEDEFGDSYVDEDGRPTDPPEPEADEAAALWVQVEVEYSRAERAYVLRTLTVDAGRGTDLTGTLLRRIAPETILRWLLPRALDVDPEAISDGLARYLMPRRISAVAVRQEGSRKDQPLTLSEVAEIYRVAEVVRDDPTQAIASTAGVSARAIRRRLETAREHGLLPGDRD